MPLSTPVAPSAVGPTGSLVAPLASHAPSGLTNTWSEPGPGATGYAQIPGAGPGSVPNPSTNNPASGLIGLTGILGNLTAGQQNSQITAQERALGQQLLQPISMGGGGGGGGGAAAGIANQIANLQNQQHDLDINQLNLQLRQLPGIGQQNLADYHTSLSDITARQNLAKLTNQQNVQQLLADATARGAMTATGTGAQRGQYAQNLADQLAQLHAQTQGAASQYHQNQTSLGKTYGQLVTDLQKMQIQKQIEQQQAKAAGLGGGGGNPLAGLASFLQRQSISQQLSGLQGQTLNPITQQAQFLNQYGTLANAYGTDMANNWLMQTLQAYGISFAGLGNLFAPGFGTTPTQPHFGTFK